MSSSSPDNSGQGPRSLTVCSLCRQRKTKCDRTLPRCGFCIKAKANCQYLSRSKKKGLRAGYVSELESRLETLEAETRQLQQQPPAINTPHPTHHSFELDNATVSEPSPVSFRVDHGVTSPDVIADLRSLPMAMFENLVYVWFKECQPWCPVIHRDVLKASLAQLSTPVEQIDDMVLRAVLALTISYSSQAISLGYRGRRRLSQHLRAQVLVEALANLSLSSIQALLVIIILDIGSDDIPSAWSLCSACRGMCERTGLFRNLLKHIENQGPQDLVIGPPAREAVAGEDLALSLTWLTLSSDSACTLGVNWRDPSGLIQQLSTLASRGMPDFSNPYRTHSHLLAVGFQPVHTLLFKREQNGQLQDDATSFAECEQICDSIMTYTHFQPPSSTYTLLSDGLIEFNPNSVLATMHANAAIILLYQPFVDLTSTNPSPSSGSQSHNPISYLAHQRCLHACQEITTTIRSLSDVDMELNCPLLATRIYTAARYQLAYLRATSTPLLRDRAFDFLMHALNMCGRRWSCARRFDIVLRAAIVGLDYPQMPTGLPPVFWDLAKSDMDIDPELKRWVAGHKLSLYVGNLDGPYV